MFFWHLIMLNCIVWMCSFLLQNYPQRWLLSRRVFGVYYNYLQQHFAVYYGYCQGNEHTQHWLWRFRPAGILIMTSPSMSFAVMIMRMLLWLLGHDITPPKKGYKTKRLKCKTFWLKENYSIVYIYIYIYNSCQVIC